MHPPLLLALWFSNPLLLWGLGAATLPILIHLLNRRRYQTLPWAAMRFLLAAVRKNQRRVKIEQWLLLAVRTLLVLAVVTAMAKPFLESLGAVALLPGQRTHWVLVLDASLSMDAAGPSGPRFDSARTLATRLVKAARPGDGISLLLLADPPRVVVGSPAFQRDPVLTELAALEVTHGAGDLPATFTRVEEVLDASDIARKEIVFITDSQAATWNVPGSSTDESLKRVFDRLTARKARSTVIDLGSAPIRNHALTSLAIEPAVVTPRTSVTIRGLVRNFARDATDDLRVQLVVDGRLGPEESLRLEAGAEQAVAFTQEFPTPGDHVVELRIDDDSLKPDNRRYQSIPVLESVQVLLVDGDPSPEPLRSETAFLAEALVPTQLDNAEPVPSPLSLEVVGESQLAGRDLSRFDVVILCNLARFTPAEVAALDAFLKRGGGVVIFGGERVVPDNYNQLLFAGGEGLLPAPLGPTLGDPAARDRSFEFDPLGYKHPILAQFSGESPGVIASLTNVKTARYHRLEVPRGSPARVALAFASGDPAVIEAPREQGRVLLVATSADTSWTSWPLHQSYVPVMEQIVLTAATGRSTERNFTVGQSLSQAFVPTAAGAPVELTTPAGKQVTLSIEPDSDVSRLTFDQALRSGVYQARIGPPENRTLDFAVNVPPAESDPARLDAAGLKAALPGWDFVYEEDWNPLSADAASVGHRGEMHRPLLWIVLTLLLLESFLAWRFGHATPRPLRTA